MATVVPIGQLAGATDGQVADLILGDGLAASAVRSAVAEATSTDGAAIQTIGMPLEVDGARNFNSTPFQQDSVIERAGFRFVALIGRGRKPWVLKQTIATGEWQTFDLSTIAGAPLSSTVDDDGHNVIVLGIDSLGYIHVSGNHHETPLRYARSNSPLDISAWTAGAMVGADENSVTYPAFVNAPDGSLLFFYRNGASGAGDLFMNRLTNPGAGTWSRASMLLSGAPTGESPYPDRYAVGADGSIHITGCWRGSGFASTNNDVFHIMSVNSGATWRTIGGTPLTTPIDHTAATTVIDTAPTGSGLLNQQGLGVDIYGHPHKAAWFNDVNGRSQIHHVWHDGSTWHNDRVSNFTAVINLSVGSLAAPLSRPGVVCAPDGRVFLMYRMHTDGLRGTMRLVDVTPPAYGLSNLGDFAISQIDYWYAEPTPIISGGKLLYLAALTAPDTVAVNSDLPSTNLYRATFATLSVVDLKQIETVAAGAGIPRVQTIASGSSSTVTDLPSLSFGPVVQVPGRRKDRLLVARMSGAVQVKSGTSTIQLVGKPAGGYSTVLGEFDLAVGRDRFFSPWLPLNLSAGDWSQGGQVTLRGVSAGTTRVLSASIEVGIVTGSDTDGISGPVLEPELSRVGNSLASSKWATGHVLADWDASFVTVADGAEVVSLRDAGPHGRTLTAPAGSGPVFDVDGLNGKPCLVFEGTDYLATAEAFFASTDYTVVVVGSVAGTGTMPQSLVSMDTNTGNARQFQVQAASATSLSFVTFTSGATANSQTGTIPASAPFVGVFQSWYASFNSRGVRGYVDGAAIFAEATITGAPADKQAIVSLGARNGSAWSNFLQGRIARVLVLAGRLSQGEIEKLSTRLAADASSPL